VIASLWSINDRATVAFMREFYARLIEGSSVAEALRHAKIWMLGSDWAHPYYWAGFLLHGNPSTSGKTN
jgi:CHAT domain-containing protein